MLAALVLVWRWLELRNPFVVVNDGARYAVDDDYDDDDGRQVY